MTRPADGPQQPGDGRGLDEIAGELYALRPDGFTAARDEHARAARAAGRRELARELGRLRRPTQSAWLVNLLWRDQPDVVEELLGLGEAIGDAQARGSGTDLHELNSRRRKLEAGLLRRGRALAQDAGVQVSADMDREAQETLGAAMASPEVAAEVRSGRLVRPVSYAGFGTASPPSAAPTAPRKSAAARVRDRGRPDRAQRRGGEPDRGREAKRRVAEARADLDAAQRQLADHGRAADEARDRRNDLNAELDRLRTELDRLRERVRDLEREVSAADREVRSAVRSRDAAERKHVAAAKELERTERELDRNG